jgi:O-antigen/teichoic acid export membrane protein
MWRTSDTPAAIALGRYATMGLSLLTVPVIARVLEPAGRGESATLLSVISVATVVLGLGVPLACRRRASAGEPLADVVITGRLFAALTLVPATLLAMALHLTLFADTPTSSVVAFYVSMALIPLSVSWAIDVSMLVALRRYRRMALLGVINSLMYFAFIVAGWLGGFLTVAVVLYAQLSSNVITFFVGLVWSPSRGGRVRDFGGMLREGMSLAGGQLADVASKRLDQIVVYPLLGASGAGLYSIASTISQVPLPVAQSLGVVAFARVNRNAPDVQEKVEEIVRHSVVLSAFSVVAIGILVPILVPPIFGPAYDQAVPLTWILLSGVFFSSISYNGAMLLAVLRKGKSMTVVQIGGSAVGVLLAMAGGGLWSAPGAAAGVSAGALVTAVGIMWRLRVTPLAAVPRPRDIRPAFREVLERS